ncbi:MAG: Maf family protein [Caulobacteraceae bacterium]
MTPLTLASRSTIRAVLLRAAGVGFEIVAPNVDEATAKRELLAAGAAPRQIAEALAAMKAVAVSRGRRGLVIGADQTLELDGALHDKAPNLEAARYQLTFLRGRMHTLHSTVTLARAGDVVWSHVETARLTMRAFSEDFLDNYLARAGASVLASVGGYQLEGEGAQLFEAIDGDYFAILGLPLVPLLEALRREGALCR